MSGIAFAQRKPCTRKGLLPLKNGKIDSRNETVFEGDLERKCKIQSGIF